MFEMIILPYAMSAFEPFISQTTMEFHYGKHYKAYVDNLNSLIKGTQFENMPLEEIVKDTYGKEGYESIFNNAGQVYNHQFFFTHLKNDKYKLDKEKIINQFGSIEKFKEQFAAKAMAQFGSGWAWLVERPDGSLEIVSTSNADTPIAHGLKPLFTIDVWEHGYYLDYQNRRKDYVTGILDNLIAW